jgi:hypothetical protein
MRYLLSYVHHTNIKKGGHAVYADSKKEEVVIKAATDEEATTQAKKEWASITGRKEKDAAVVFVSLVKELSWKPKNKKVPLDEKVFFEND